ncbi:hypothetical protein pEaSNUABM50_00016 [Erwinia phage pEa_SNUABM_50]|uniref:Uncharacterized protein n=1 Tax=Erwinia phage pEa_SNUABM_50 TaxID=2768775 RepID=A0A7L8ZPR0_9CAUD|nr:hypothetical protein pEaSNUABM50_00016 [Erwinia phage pEa_SNUABM_50]QXO11163.1 hypothetical protein pEaSNUABM19_00017 [Erwinia phage pEa_SNUABM_19]
MAQKDRRYSIAAEFTGHISGKKRQVLRFCGACVSDHATRHEAEQEIVKWKASGEVPAVQSQRVLVEA